MITVVQLRFQIPRVNKSNFYPKTIYPKPFLTAASSFQSLMKITSDKADAWTVY